MKPVKKLSLKKETLSELTDDQMRFVAGGADLNSHTYVGWTCEVPCHVTESCISNNTECPTIDNPCATQSCTFREWCNFAIA